MSNIRLAYDFDKAEFKSLLPEIQVFDWDKDRNEKIDLLIFPGGEDVSLDYYLDIETIQKYGHLCHTNKKRDMYESMILAACFNGKLNVNKIMGVCRGFQFLSVMFGGSLYFDLSTYGYPHESIHKLHHITVSNLGFFKEVNSLHHQGVKALGDDLYRLDINQEASPKRIAMDETGCVIEMGTWMNNKVLGVQFHPEYYDSNNPDKINFREFLYGWISNTTTIGA